MSSNRIDLSNGVANIHGRATAGFGVPAIYAENVIGVVTGAQTGIVSFTPSTNAGRYKIGGNIALTSGTNTGTVGLQVNYVDGNGTTHTADVMALIKQDGTVVQTGTGASTDWKAVDCEITIDASGTAISIDSAVSGSVHYITSAYIMQVA